MDIESRLKNQDLFKQSQCRNIDIWNLNRLNPLITYSPTPTKNLQIIHKQDNPYICKRIQRSTEVQRPSQLEQPLLAHWFHLLSCLDSTRPVDDMEHQTPTYSRAQCMLQEHQEQRHLTPEELKQQREVKKPTIIPSFSIVIRSFFNPLIFKEADTQVSVDGQSPCLIIKLSDLDLRELGSPDKILFRLQKRIPILEDKITGFNILAQPKQDMENAFSEKNLNITMSNQQVYQDCQYIIQFTRSRQSDEARDILSRWEFDVKQVYNQVEKNKTDFYCILLRSNKFQSKRYMMDYSQDFYCKMLSRDHIINCSHAFYHSKFQYQQIQLSTQEAAESLANRINDEYEYDTQRAVIYPQTRGNRDENNCNKLSNVFMQDKLFWKKPNFHQVKNVNGADQNSGERDKDKRKHQTMINPLCKTNSLSDCIDIQGKKASNRSKISDKNDETSGLPTACAPLRTISSADEKKEKLEVLAQMKSRSQSKTQKESKSQNHSTSAKDQHHTNKLDESIISEKSLRKIGSEGLAQITNLSLDNESQQKQGFQRNFKPNDEMRDDCLEFPCKTECKTEASTKTSLSTFIGTSSDFEFNVDANERRQPKRSTKNLQASGSQSDKKPKEVKELKLIKNTNCLLGGELIIKRKREQ